MPTMKNRKGGNAPDSQINQTAGQDGNGVQTFDGRENLNRGTQVSATPQSLDGPGKVVRTFGA